MARISISNILMGSTWGTALVLTLYLIGDAQLLGALAAVLIAAVFFTSCDTVSTSNRTRKTAARRTY